MLDSETVSALHDGINSLLDVLDSYRAAAIARGYSPTAAEMMTVELNAGLMRSSFPQVIQGKAS